MAYVEFSVDKVPVWDDGSSGSLGQPSGHEQILVTKNLYK